MPELPDMSTPESTRESSTPSRRSSHAARGRWRRAASLAVVLGVGLLGACTAQQQPSSYDDAKYEENFMLGCTGQDPDGESPEGYEELASTDYCECVFKGLEETVPFKETEEFEKSQAEAEDGADIEVPENIQKVFDGCAPGSN